MRIVAATLLLCLLAWPALASEPPDMNGYPSWGNRLTGYQAVKEPRWATSNKRAGKRHVKAKHARRSPVRRMRAPYRAYMAGVVAPLAAKAREIEAACGSRVISAIRHTRIAGTGGRLSLHASGRAVDMQGNPQCMYKMLVGWPGGVSTDYGAVDHVHFSYAPGGPEWGMRFQHYRGHRHKRHSRRSSFHLINDRHLPSLRLAVVAYAVARPLALAHVFQDVSGFDHAVIVQNDPGEEVRRVDGGEGFGHALRTTTPPHQSESHAFHL